MKKKIEYFYDKNNTLKIVINIKLSFSETLSSILFTITLLPPALFLTSIMLLGALSLKIFLLSIKDILLLLLITILADFMGFTTLCHLLKYSFGKEIIILNNKNKSLTYQQLVLGFGKIRVFDYCNITKIKDQTKYGRYSDYCSCSLIQQEKEFRFGIVNDIMEGRNIARRINDFLIR